MRTTKFRRLATTMALALTGLAVSAVAPAAPAAQAAPAHVQATTAEAVEARVEARAADLIGYRREPVDWNGQRRGYIDIWVYSDGAKEMLVCDQNGDHLKVGIQVDWSGPAAPTLHQDDNGVASPCDAYITYSSIRKFRAGLHDENNEGIAWYWGPWFNTPPLPYPDF